MRIYYFIHLTGRDTGNTGIQRVVRNLGRYLQGSSSVELVPVRWCHEQDAVVHAEQSFLDVISRYDGPSFTLSTDAGHAVHESAKFQGNGDDWLLVPEVPHLQSHDARYPSVAILEPLGYCCRVGLRSAVVFHDLLPLTHPDELAEVDVAGRLAFTVYGQALLRADLIIPNSVSSAQALVEWCRNYGYDGDDLPPVEPILLPEEMVSIPRGLPERLIGGNTAGPLEFVATGTVCARKNQLRVIEAFNRLSKRRPELNLRLHIVGHVDPRLAANLAYQVKRSNGCVHVYGYVDDGKLRELISRARATIFTSLAEGYGLPVVESLWIGKPCLTSNLGSMAEIAEGGGCLTVDPTSVVEIERGIERLATDEEIYHSLLHELQARKFRTWADYAACVVSALQGKLTPVAVAATKISALAGSGRPPSLRQPANRAGFHIDAHELTCHSAYPTGDRNSLFNGDCFHYREELHGANPQQVLFYGPYISLEPAVYRFHLRGRIKGRMVLRITAETGQMLLEQLRLSTFDVPITLVITEPLQAFELTGLRTSSLSSMELHSIFVERFDLGRGQLQSSSIKLNGRKKNRRFFPLKWLWFGKSRLSSKSFLKVLTAIKERFARRKAERELPMLSGLSKLKHAIRRIIFPKHAMKPQTGDAATLAPEREGQACGQAAKLTVLKIEDLDRAAEAFQADGTRTGGKWDEFRNCRLVLPDWYDHSLDPFSHEYARQQDRLWRLVTGKLSDYAPEQNEQTPEVSQMDPLVRPGFYLSSTEVAGDHVIALGHLLKCSDVSAGDRVIEYGAGFGQIALTFARLGAVVDTVDVSPDFCSAVAAQAKWFNVPLSAFQDKFGVNPRPGERYKLVIFYEAFHHCRNFLEVIPTLREIVASDGKILLAGEPVEEVTALDQPYPWGLNLGAEGAAVMRIRGWYELVFEEEFLLRCFIRNGFVFRKHPGVISRYATIYEFRPRPQIVNLGTWKLTPRDDATWHGVESNGRWTTAHSKVTIDCTSPWNRLTILTVNHHARAGRVSFRYAGNEQEVAYQAGEQVEVTFKRKESGDCLEILCAPISPKSYGVQDSRHLGIFVKHLEYLS
jgi:glycosyltransferase involved in cell wall biosynthesis/2-polyprenyl-3-methyl-5-hydroxy-6-metoxy-1,4-benzoquinol methylase